jgi:hypothetical protein
MEVEAEMCRSSKEVLFLHKTGTNDGLKNVVRSGGQNKIRPSQYP